MADESEYVQEWFLIADRDLERAHRRTEDGDLEDAGFRIQQAAEKYLKGHLAKHGKQVRFTHDLDSLLDEVCETDQSFEEFRGACQSITAYYMWDRYPTIHDHPLGEEEIHEALEWVEKLKAKAS